MSTAWVGIIGAIVGGLITFLSGYYLNRLQRKNMYEQRWLDRKETVYSDILLALNNLTDSLFQQDIDPLAGSFVGKPVRYFGPGSDLSTPKGKCFFEIARIRQVNKVWISRNVYHILNHFEFKYLKAYKLLVYNKSDPRWATFDFIRKVVVDIERCEQYICDSVEKELHRPKD